MFKLENYMFCNCIMELLLIGSLAVLGYELSKSGKISRNNNTGEPLKQSCKPLNKYPIQNTNPNSINVPYYSARSYGTDPYFENNYTNYAQNKMENFTGTSDVTFKHKCEQENLFKPQKDISHINGAPVNMDESKRTNRFINSITNKMHNVAPIEKQYIGPGLNVDDKTQASGGFHDTFRILPTNIADYTKNNFGGRIVPGKSITPNRNSLPTIQDNQKPEKYYTINDRHVFPTKSEYTSCQFPSNYNFLPSIREQCVPHTNSGPSYTNGSQQYSDPTRNYDSTKCSTIINQAYTKASYKPGTYTMTHTDREHCGDIINPHSYVNASVSTYTDNANGTQREEQFNQQGHLHKSSTTLPTYDNSNHEVPLTSREETSTSLHGHLSSSAKSQYTHKYHIPMTHRESTDNKVNTGPAGSLHKGTTNQHTYRNSSPYYQREEMGVPYTPGSGRMNLVSDPDIINTEYRPDCNVQEISNLKAHNKIKTVDQQGQIQVAPKIPVLNSHNQYSIAVNQLSDNPYAAKPYSQQK
uniref:DUF5899 domain-containing protein n=1 Tax=viral metagenome TaxID=1070528 RepID=A0A6C0F5D7_9ZZZZ